MATKEILIASSNEMATINSSLTQTNSLITEMRSSINGVKSDISNIKSTINTVNANVNTVKSNVSNIVTDVAKAGDYVLSAPKTLICNTSVGNNWYRCSDVTISGNGFITVFASGGNLRFDNVYIDSILLDNNSLGIYINFSNIVEPSRTIYFGKSIKFALMTNGAHTIYYQVGLK